jgi:hypothetical protein
MQLPAWCKHPLVTHGPPSCAMPVRCGAWHILMMSPWADVFPAGTHDVFVPVVVICCRPSLPLEPWRGFGESCALLILPVALSSDDGQSQLASVQGALHAGPALCSSLPHFLCRYVSTGQHRSFSEQQIIDCSWNWGPNGCGERPQDNRSAAWLFSLDGIVAQQQQQPAQQLGSGNSVAYKQQQHTCVLRRWW